MMRTEELFIPNKHGLKLAAKLDSPLSGKIKAYAVFAHCFTCSMELKSIANINRVLTEIGIAVLRFDMTGIGGSEGFFPDTNFTTQIEDFLSASGYLAKSHKPAKLLIGHSLGGSVALFSAFKLPHAKAVVTIAAPAEPANLAVKLKNTKARANIENTAEAEIGGVKLKFKPQFFHDIESYSLKEKLPNLNKPYLIMHSNADTYSEITNAEKLFKNAAEPKSLITFDNIDHLMLKKKDAEKVGRLIGEWAEKYM